MSEVDWREVPPHPTSSPDSEGVSPLETHQLPEVVNLVADGWSVAPDAPVWSFLPALWPDELRTWVRDRSTRYGVSYRSSGQDEFEQARSPLTRADLEDLERTATELADAAGFPSRPTGRVWLLRPVGSAAPDEVCDIAQNRVGNDEFFASRRLSDATRDVIDELTT